tara:strand:- start:945 stop:1823 length:879 start_codon:yes stop_codon:yes gene_type:complete
MTKVIYSLYIDIPEEELDGGIPYYGEKESKSLKTKREMKKYYDWLKQMHVNYARNTGVDYKLFEYDNDFKDYKKWFTDKYPEITTYNIVNFYKIYLMYELSKQYEDILYLDFDAVPVSNNNFFDTWDLTKGIAILTNKSHVDTNLHTKNIKKISQSVRSPTAKYWNCRALLLESNMSGKNEVYNTGIVGINRYHLKKLNYWSEFDKLISKMNFLIKDKDSMFPTHIQNIFGYDNETIWSYKMEINNVSVQYLTEEWHHFMDKWNYIPKYTNIVHVINKNFKYVKDWHEKNNL